MHTAGVTPLHDTCRRVDHWCEQLTVPSLGIAANFVIEPVGPTRHECLALTRLQSMQHSCCIGD
jgi:hypothetical protein